MGLRKDLIFLLVLLAAYVYVDNNQPMFADIPLLINGLAFFDANVRPLLVDAANAVANAALSWVHDQTATPIRL